MSLPHVDAAARSWSPLPPTRVTPAHAVAALQTAVHGLLEGQSPGWDLRRALRTLCDLAHRENLRVEELLLLLKQAWQSLPEVRDMPPGRERQDLLSRIVSMCIEEFYVVQE